MSYENTVKLISEYLARELNLSNKEKDKIRFGLELFISTIFSLFISLILAWLLDILQAVIFVLIVGPVFKTLSGGIHFKTIWECGMFTAITSNLLGLISTRYHIFFYHNWSMFLLLSFFYIIISLLLWSPSDVSQRPINDKKEHRFFKFTSILVSLMILITTIILFNFYKEKFAIVATSLIFGVLFQAFAISPLAYRLQSYYYSLKNK